MSESNLPNAAADAHQGWWCLFSHATGHYWTEEAAFTEDCALQWSGAVLVYHDQGDAERAAVALRHLWPLMMIEAMPLPAIPPRVCRGVQAQSSLAAFQLDVGVGELPDQFIVARVEIRPEAGRNADFARALRALIEQALAKSPTLRLRMTKVIELGLSPAPVVPTTQPENK